jgi:hypothetical protein
MTSKKNTKSDRQRDATLFGRRVSIAKSKRAALDASASTAARSSWVSIANPSAPPHPPLPTPSLRVQIAALLDSGARLDRKSKRARRICRQADRKSKRTPHLALPTPSAPRVSIANPSALRVQIAALLASKARQKAGNDFENKKPRTFFFFGGASASSRTDPDRARLHQISGALGR